MKYLNHLYLFRNFSPQSHFRYSEIAETFTFISYILYTNV